MFPTTVSPLLFSTNSSGRPAASAWRGLAAVAIGCSVAVSAQANPFVGTMALPVAIEDVAALSDAKMDEITVYGSRSDVDDYSAVMVDPLQTRILEDIRELKLLDEEFEWRMETSHLKIAPPRIQLGYDPRDDTRTPALPPQATLPLDLMQPATVVSIDF